MLLLAAPALSQTAPDLGEAFDFAVLGTNASPTTGTVTCTNTGSGSTIDGNVGSTGGFSNTTVPPCTVTGDVDTNLSVVGPEVNAFNDAYAALDADNPTCDGPVPTTSTTLPPGVYCSGAETTIGAGVIITLDGDAADVWVFKIGTGGGGALTGTSMQVVMEGTAEACNVYWWTADAATMTDSSFIGTVLSGDAITMTRGSWLGRAQATTDVTVTDAAPMTFAGCAAPAEITVNKDFSDDNPDPVSVELTCTSGTVEDTPLDASEAEPAVFTVGAADPGATCTATETVPEGYTADQTDCEEVELDGSCTIINTLIPGSITIVKETFGGDGTFGFTGDLGAFDITTADGTGSQVFADVDPGIHDVTEIVPAGWDLTSITCSNDSATDVGTATASIEVAPEENVTCTFANSQLPGTLIVEKRTNPPGSDQIFTFTGDAAGDLTHGGQIIVDNLAPGNYSSTETVPEGWQLTSIICNDADSTGDLTTATANFVLDADETVTCVFLNTEDDVEDGTITILKQASPPGTGQSFNFTGDLGNFSLMHGQFIIEPRPPGTYAVAETVPPGWQLDSATCDDGSPIDAIVLEAGENVTCTFANSQLPGTLIVEKRTNPPGSDQIFTFTGDAAGDLTHGEQIVVDNLAPGNYSSTETVPEGWQLTSIICNDADSTGDLTTATANFVLDADETVTCVFLNTEDDVEDGTITILKQASPPGTGQSFNFTGDLGNFSLMHGQFIIEPRPPGTYAVAETVPPGWQLDSATCDDGSPVDAIVLEAGENVTCRFANSILAVPAISVPVFSQGGVALLLLIMLLIASVFLQNSGLYRR